MKNKIIFVIGRMASVFGTEIYNFVFALFILYTTGSAISFAITLMLEVIPKILFSTFAGIISDRYDRKKIIIGCDIISGIILLIAYGIYRIQDNMFIIYVLTFILNAIATMFDITMNASLDMLFEKKHFQQMCSINEGISSIVAIGAPTLGAMIYAMTDFSIFLLINGISFLISALMESQLVFHQRVIDNIKHHTFKEEIRISIDYISKQRVILVLYLSAIFINIFYNISVALAFPYIITNILKLSEMQFGMLETALAVGMICGAGFLTVMKNNKSRRSILTSLCGEGTAIFLLALPVFITKDINWFLFYIIVLFTLGFSCSCVNISVRVLMQKIIPSNIKGKVLGTLSAICLSISPIFTMASAAYIDHNNPFTLIVISGIGFMILNAFLLKNKSLKQIPVSS